MRLMQTKKAMKNTVSSKGLQGVLENEKYISHMQKEHTLLSAMKDT